MILDSDSSVLVTLNSDIVRDADVGVMISPSQFTLPRCTQCRAFAYCRESNLVRCTMIGRQIQSRWHNRFRGMGTGPLILKLARLAAEQLEMRKQLVETKVIDEPDIYPSVRDI